ncbi:unnamed protein product [Adineta ricciae]|uniref:N-acetyltransferase domain-containing protein n=1 Tax=Adineta ricciae TaxID=249248 RepID=A0A815DET6_ADIRI|nr:unnamed protein product [Adineta ricciae]CAF1596433.1 unnamed protein product [Adineta ricciae]
MTGTHTSRQGHVFDDYSNSDVNLFFASYDDIEDLCKIINWAYRGKPSSSSSQEPYSGWVGEQHLLSGDRITSEQLRELIDDEPDTIILVAKLKTPSGLEIVGCCKVNRFTPNLQINAEDGEEASVEFGLHAVDPDYQSRGIGKLLYNGAMRIAKEHFNAKRVYLYVISSKQNQIDWHLRQGFVDTKQTAPFPFDDTNRFKAKVNPDEIKFAILVKNLP